MRFLMRTCFLFQAAREAREPREESPPVSLLRRFAPILARSGLFVPAFRDVLMNLMSRMRIGFRCSRAHNSGDSSCAFLRSARDAPV